jgi:hypothetical protein
MKHDLIYTPKIIDAQCYQCSKVFKLYEIQKMPINFCHTCAINNKLTELITLSIVVKKIVEYAEKQNQRVNDRLVVDIQNLIDDLQRGTNE